MASGRGSGPADPLVLRALVVMFVANGFVYASFIPRLAEVRDSAGLSIAGLGLVLTVGSLAALVASFFPGQVVALLGSRRIVVVGGVCYALALPAIGFAGSATVLVVALVVLAVADVFVDVALNLQAATVSARRDRPVMSRLHGLWSLGALTGGAVAAGAAHARVPIGLHYAGVAALVIAAVVLGGRHLLPVDEPHPDQQPVAENLGNSGRSWWRVMFGPGVLLLMLANAMAETVETTTGEWSGLRLHDDLQAGPGTAGLAFVLFTAGMASGRFVGDHVTARLGSSRTARSFLLLTVAGVLLATLTTTPLAALGGVVLIGLGASVMNPLLADAAARAPGRPGAGFTALFIGHRATGLYIPATLGLLANSSTFSVGQAMALVMLPSLAVLALIAGRVLKPPRRHPPD